MKLSESFAYDGADVTRVYALITDTTFRTEACAEVGAQDYEVSVEPTGAGHTVTVVRTVKAELPDFIRKLTGDTVKVKQTEAWGPAAADGTRTADVKVSIIGQPAEMLGTAVLSTAGAGTSFVLDGEVKVSIPFIGRKIEPEIAKAIVSSLRDEVDLGTKRL